MIYTHTSLRGLQIGVALLAASIAPPVLAQQAPTQDPGIVITRTVNPRIAYRGVPLEDNPVHTRATTFPARIFHDNLNAALGGLADDAELGSNTGSAGVVIDATQWLLVPAADARMINGPGMSGNSPLGLDASAGGSIGGATQGLAGTVIGAVMGAVQATAPAGGP